MTRPYPPEQLTQMDHPEVIFGGFVPAPEVVEWARTMFIDEGAHLENPDYAHLRSAEIDCLWTNVVNSRNQRAVVGSAELGMPMVAAGKWVKARLQCQLEQWFGRVPDFLITLDAWFCTEVDDVSFCALIEHELSHCGQEHDRFGAPRFSRDTGRPKFAIQAHDVEEFVGVVRRYGMDATRTRELVEAATAGPEIGEAKISGLCGACLKAVA